MTKRTISLSLRFKEKGFSTAYLNEPAFDLRVGPRRAQGIHHPAQPLSASASCRSPADAAGPFSTRSTLALFDRLSLIEVFLNWTAVCTFRARWASSFLSISLVFNLHPFQASLLDLAGRFLPFWLLSGLTMHWLSGARVVPILSDVSQIIVMPQILKAVVFGLSRPQGQKFEVTAKGGDRNRGVCRMEGVAASFCLLDRHVVDRRSGGLLREERSR